MHIIAVSTIKGGVGKMTTAVNPACLVAASGRSTVLWDLDPQGTAACVLRGEPREQASARQLVRGKLEIAGLVANTAYVNLGRVPGRFLRPQSRPAQQRAQAQDRATAAHDALAA